MYFLKYHFDLNQMGNLTTPQFAFVSHKSHLCVYIFFERGHKCLKVKCSKYSVNTCFSFQTFSFSECWNPEPHQRPSFAEILNHLREIADSPFIDTPHESFRSMQQDWKQEIQEMFDEIRLKEKVHREKPKDHLINSSGLLIIMN